MTHRAHAIFFPLLKGLGIALLALVAAAAVAIVPTAVSLRAVYGQALAGREAVTRAQAAAERLDLNSAEASLDEAAGRFKEARFALDRLGPVARLPYAEREVRAVSLALSGGHEAAAALRETVGIASDLLSVAKSGAGVVDLLPDIGQDERPAGSLTREERRELLAKMLEAPERLAAARAGLDRAIAAFDAVEPTPLTEGVLSALGPQKRRLAEIRDLLARDLSFLSKAPLLLGYPESKTYLFLLLNNTELRPGGGFIGTYGIVRMADGEIEKFYADDVYALDGPAEAYLKEEPPEPIRRYLRVPGWFMRDANWSPDFVESAKTVERFYHLEKGKEKEIDAVIGITPTFISKLLEITGPVTVDGVRFDAANVTDELEFQVERGFYEKNIPYFQRKGIVGRFGEEMVKMLLATPVSRLPGIAEAVEKSVEEKHVMAWFKEQALQTFVEARGASGRFPIYSGDGLMVVDANMAALKTDRVVDRTISYSIRPEGRGFVARAAVTYKNNGRFDWRTTRYRTYTRFYVPPGSEFMKGEGMMADDKLNDPGRRAGAADVSEDLGRAVFGAFISVEPGETRTLAVEYRLPESVAAMIRGKEYRLDVRKQPGTVAHGLTLDLDFGKKVARAAPAEDRKEWRDARYRYATDLRVDRSFRIGF